MLDSEKLVMRPPHSHSSTAAPSHTSRRGARRARARVTHDHHEREEAPVDVGVEEDGVDAEVVAVLVGLRRASGLRNSSWRAYSMKPRPAKSTASADGHAEASRQKSRGPAHLAQQRRRATRRARRRRRRSGAPWRSRSSRRPARRRARPQRPGAIRARAARETACRALAARACPVGRRRRRRSRLGACPASELCDHATATTRYSGIKQVRGAAAGGDGKRGRAAPVRRAAGTPPAGAQKSNASASDHGDRGHARQPPQAQGGGADATSGSVFQTSMASSTGVSTSAPSIAARTHAP